MGFSSSRFHYSKPTYALAWRSPWFTVLRRNGCVSFKTTAKRKVKFENMSRPLCWSNFYWAGFAQAENEQKVTRCFGMNDCTFRFIMKIMVTWLGFCMKRMRWGSFAPRSIERKGIEIVLFSRMWFFSWGHNEQSEKELMSEIVLYDKKRAITGFFFHVEQKSWR